MNTIDLNSDVGESFGRWKLGDDVAMFRSITSANVACGFHAGDPSVMRATCASAAASGIQVGAHPGYRDMTNFGRRFLDVDAIQLTDEIVYQIGALQAIANAAGARVTYVKPHGALGNAIVHHAGHAQAVVDAVKSVDPALPILALPNSEILTRAEAAGLRGVAEAFADRAYTSDGRLASRSLPGSVLHDVDEVALRVVRMVLEGKIATVDGEDISVTPESICLHGDTAGAVEMAFRVRSALQSAGISIKSFA